MEQSGEGRPPCQMYLRTCIAHQNWCMKWQLRLIADKLFGKHVPLQGKKYSSCEEMCTFNWIYLSTFYELVKKFIWTCLPSHTRTPVQYSVCSCTFTISTQFSTLASIHNDTFTKEGKVFFLAFSSCFTIMYLMYACMSTFFAYLQHILILVVIWRKDIVVTSHPAQLWADRR